jgi:hypothetical protein
LSAEFGFKWGALTTAITRSSAASIKSDNSHFYLWIPNNFRVETFICMIGA